MVNVSNGITNAVLCICVRLTLILLLHDVVRIEER